jgi:hypothetical protein
MSALTQRTIARSISRPVNERLRRGQLAARVLAVFEHACDLVTPDGEVVALVTPPIGDGPLNIVVEGAGGLFAGVERGAPVKLEQDRLCAGGLQVYLGAAKLWEPRPNWELLRARRAAVGARLPRLRTLCLTHAPVGSLLALLGAPSRGDRIDGTVLSVAQRAAEALRAGWEGDLGRWQEGATGLAGLGGGLTPAGDDFLIGAMLAAWLAHPAPEPFGRALAAAAVPRTTTLSAALLRATARGECSAPWHALLDALSAELERPWSERIDPADRPRGKIEDALCESLARGATSGADGLAGFLYLIADSDQ